MPLTENAYTVAGEGVGRCGVEGLLFSVSPVVEELLRLEEGELGKYSYRKLQEESAVRRQCVH